MNQTFARLAMVVVAIGFAFTASAASDQWARMAELESTIGIDTRADQVYLSIPLKDVAGRTRFTFTCRGGSDLHVSAVGEATGINYVPPLMCLLNDGEFERELSLLAEDDSAPWFSRGMFHWSQLVGACGAYPEFGRLRTFLLRGFELRLEARDLAYNGGQLVYFNLHVRVRNAPAATTKSAQRPNVLPPGSDCEIVRKGEEPRMCRNWAKGGAYEPCRD